MFYVKLSKKKNDSYSIEVYNNENLTTLADFLVDEVRPKDSFWKNWINQKEAFPTGGNIISLKKEKEFILVDYTLSEIPHKYVVRVHQENLLEVLDQWEQLCKERPQEIWIFEENGRVWLEGKNF